MSVSEEIKRLHELNQAGALSDAEFAQAKARLLNGPAVGKDVGGGELVQEFNRLRRSPRDRWLGGVCGGIAAITGVASWAWRLVFALLVMCAGTGLLIYLLLWILVPEEAGFSTGPTHDAHSGPAAS